jgi:hypothetical protein
MFDVMGESLTGDVYAEPSRWRALSLGSLFSEGWVEPWASPPNGEGGAPRQGWLNAFDGVFYRLGIGTFGFANEFNENGDQYTGGLTFYTPFNRRFELRTDIPVVVSNRGTAATPPRPRAKPQAAVAAAAPVPLRPGGQDRTPATPYAGAPPRGVWHLGGRPTAVSGVRLADQYGIRGAPQPGHSPACGGGRPTGKHAV